MTKLSVLEGMGEAYQEKLNAAGIQSVEDYLKACATKADRVELAEKTGISEELILTWANHADLIRIKGIGGKYSRLLEAAGVDTVPELATRNAENLYKKILETNDAKGLVQNLPLQEMVEDWVKQAKALPRMLQY